MGRMAGGPIICSHRCSNCTCSSRSEPRRCMRVPLRNFQHFWHIFFSQRIHFSGVDPAPRVAQPCSSSDSAGGACNFGSVDTRICCCQTGGPLDDPPVDSVGGEVAFGQIPSSKSPRRTVQQPLQKPWPQEQITFCFALHPGEAHVAAWRVEGFKMSPSFLITRRRPICLS